MSYILDGKLANQCPEAVNLCTPKVHCEKCNKLVDFPERKFMSIGTEVFSIYHYLQKEDLFIYEAKRGRAVVYCSDYCRRKHNHRFKNEKK